MASTRAVARVTVAALEKMTAKELRVFIEKNMPGEVSKALGGSQRRTKRDIVGDITAVLAADGNGSARVAARSTESSMGARPTGNGNQMRASASRAGPTSNISQGARSERPRASTTTDLMEKIQRQAAQSREAIDLWVARRPLRAEQQQKAAAQPSRVPIPEQSTTAIGWLAAAVVGGAAVAAVANVPLAKPSDEAFGCLPPNDKPELIPAKIGEPAAVPGDPIADQQLQTFHTTADRESSPATGETRQESGSTNSVKQHTDHAERSLTTTQSPADKVLVPMWYAEAKAEIACLQPSVARDSLSQPWSRVYQSRGVIEDSTPSRRGDSDCEALDDRQLSTGNLGGVSTSNGCAVIDTAGSSSAVTPVQPESVEGAMNEALQGAQGKIAHSAQVHSKGSKEGSLLSQGQSNAVDRLAKGRVASRSDGIWVWSAARQRWQKPSEHKRNFGAAYLATIVASSGPSAASKIAGMPVAVAIDEHWLEVANADCSGTYFWNRTTDATTWERPRTVSRHVDSGQALLPTAKPTAQQRFLDRYEASPAAKTFANSGNAANRGDAAKLNLDVGGGFRKDNRVERVEHGGDAKCRTNARTTCKKKLETATDKPNQTPPASVNGRHAEGAAEELLSSESSDARNIALVGRVSALPPQDSQHTTEQSDEQTLFPRCVAAAGVSTENSSRQRQQNICKNKLGAGQSRNLDGHTRHVSVASPRSLAELTTASEMDISKLPRTEMMALCRPTQTSKPEDSFGGFKLVNPFVTSAPLQGHRSPAQGTVPPSCGTPLLSVKQCPNCLTNMQHPSQVFADAVAMDPCVELDRPSDLRTTSDTAAGSEGRAVMNVMHLQESIAATAIQRRYRHHIRLRRAQEGAGGQEALQDLTALPQSLSNESVVDVDSADSELARLLIKINELRSELGEQPLSFSKLQSSKVEG
eukprot:SAG11_NODE_29_length_23137_cov_16.739995_19_plen_927_part_00